MEIEIEIEMEREKERGDILPVGGGTQQSCPSLGWCAAQSFYWRRTRLSCLRTTSGGSTDIPALLPESPLPSCPSLR